MNITLNVRDLMQIRVHAVPPEMPLVDLEQEFIDKRVSGFPVVDAGQLVGVVSRSDIVRQLEVERQLAENTSDFYWDRAGFHEERADSMQQIASRVGQRIEDLRVRDLMSQHVVAVSADDSLSVLAQKLLEHHIHRVLVVEHGRLAGIVSALDLVKLFADKRVTCT
jgi:CBS domain-containing protein